MGQNLNLIPVLPEIFILGMILVLLLVDSFSSKKCIVSGLSIFTLLAASAGLLYFYIQKAPPSLSFNNMFLLDKMAIISKIFVCLLSAVVLIYARVYLKDKEIASADNAIMLLFAVLGSMVMISGFHMIVLYVGLELLSLSLFGMIALDKTNVKATEAAMKFFILSALASGLLLFGISFIYGATGGALGIRELMGVFMGQQAVVNQTLLNFGLVFVVAGLAFKLGLAPFHMWIPDVYEGSPLSTTAFVGTVTKIAAAVFIFRFLDMGLYLQNGVWVNLMLGIGLVSILVGSTVGIVQTNLRRMLAYSTIANMGFVALGFVSVNTAGISAVMFYTISYSITALASFGILIALSGAKHECNEISDLRGLGKSHPILAGLFLLVMFSMAGIPPLVGFYAKFSILSSLVAAGYVKSAVLAMVFSLFAAFYYIRVVKVMYFETGEAKQFIADLCPVTKLVLALNCLLLLVLGVLPSGLMHLCYSMFAN